MKQLEQQHQKQQWNNYNDSDNGTTTNDCVKNYAKDHYNNHTTDTDHDNDHTTDHDCCVVNT